MFGTSGIRGRVGSEVTAALALSVGRAVGADADRAVVGRDPRESGHVLVDALAAGLREVGTDVVDLGLAATPTIARAVAWAGADAGVSVTASHNPPPDNGIKLWQPSGQAFDAVLRDRIAERVRADALDDDLAAWNHQGTRTRPADDGEASPRERHVAAVVDAGRDLADLSVVVDLGNGAGGVAVAALDRLGADVETLNAQPDGRFPGRPSEPTAENCASLAALVGGTDADLGVAHDGDADRMRAVAADGTFPTGDALLAVLAREAARPGDRVAVPVDTSLAVADYLADRDVAVEYTPVGDVHVADAAAREGVAFGGEPSGAWIWPDETLCPDGPLAAVRLAGLAAERPLAARLDEVPHYPIRRANVETDDKAGVMERVRASVRADYAEADVETLDGVRVDPGSGWFLVRASGTQPLIRVTAEARDVGRAEDLHEAALELVRRALDGG